MAQPLTRTRPSFAAMQFLGRRPDSPLPAPTGVDGRIQRVDNGVLVYRRVENRVAATWFDRTGRQLGALGTSGHFGDVVLSPTALRLAVSVMDPALFDAEYLALRCGRLAVASA